MSASITISEKNQKESFYLFRGMIFKGTKMPKLSGILESIMQNRFTL